MSIVSFADPAWRVEADWWLLLTIVVANEYSY